MTPRQSPQKINFSFKKQNYRTVSLYEKFIKEEIAQTKKFFYWVLPSELLLSHRFLKEWNFRKQSTTVLLDGSEHYLFVKNTFCKTL